MSDQLVCGCPGNATHIPTCVLGRAETIAVEALGTADLFTHPLTAALIALTEAGLLPETPPDLGVFMPILLGLLDDLYETHLLATPTTEVTR